MKLFVKRALMLLVSAFMALSMFTHATAAFADVVNEGKDVSKKLTFTRFDIKHHSWKPGYAGMEMKDFDANHPVKSAIGESAYINYDVEIPNDVKAGDYFIIDYGDNVRPGGIESPIALTPLISEGQYITDVLYDEASNRVFHKFNKKVEEKDNIKAHYTDPIWPKYNKITTNNTPYTVTLTVGGKDVVSKNMTYDYCNELQGKKVVFGANINVDSLGNKNTITQVWHVNRYGEKVPDGNHTLLWEPNTGDKFESIKVYEVTDDRAITDSPNPNPTYVKEIDVKPVVGQDGKARVDLGNGLAEGKKYIVVTVANPTGNQSTDWLSVRNKDDKSRQQDSMGITIGVNNSAASGQGENIPGMFVEIHRYETLDQNGNVVRVDETVTKFPQKGYKNEQYTTGKEDRAGYRFVRAENPVNEPTYSEKGEKTKGYFKPGMTQEITYVYQRKPNYGKDRTPNPTPKPKPEPGPTPNPEPNPEPNPNPNPEPGPTPRPTPLPEPSPSPTPTPTPTPQPAPVPEHEVPNKPVPERSELPKTGVSSAFATLTAALLSSLGFAIAGFGFLRKKNQ